MTRPAHNRLSLHGTTHRTHQAPALALALSALTGLALLSGGCGEPAGATPADAPAGSNGADAAKTAQNPKDPAPATPAPATAEKPATPPPPPPPVDETVDENQVQTVRKLVDDSISSDTKLAQPAIDRLKEMGSLAAVPLAEIVDRDKDTPARRIAAMDQLESLKFMTNPRATKAVLAALNDDNAELKHHAIGVCGRHKLKDAMPALKTIMNDPAQKTLQILAAQALVELGDPDAIALARKLLESPDPIVRGRAVYMIRKQGDHTQAKLLKPLATDKDDDVRTEVVEACGELGDVESVEVLGGMLDDKNHEILRDVCKHLKRISGVPIARDPEKWKEWINKEFTPKGKAAFGKAAEAQAAPPPPGVKKNVKVVPPNGGPDMPPPPPAGDDDGLGENGND